MISAGLVGLFWILVGQLEEEKSQQLHHTKPKRANSSDIFINLKEFILNNFKQEIDLYQPSAFSVDQNNAHNEIDDLEEQSMHTLDGDDGQQQDDDMDSPIRIRGSREEKPLKRYGTL